MNENSKDYKTIGEVAKILNLVDKKTGKLATHTIRYWEKEFKQIKPKIFSGNRRYYDEKNIEILMKVKFLLKDKGMTIKGAKKELERDYSKLDEINNISINPSNFKYKLKKISNILKDLKNNGKKNTR